uniref:Uncharacterized protein n=1 Tax=Helianthus annuus TaxID=4232 RepID=A0A251T419_HELAN
MLQRLGSHSIRLHIRVLLLRHSKNMISQCVTVGGSRSYFVDLLHGILKFDPVDRLTAQ